MAGILIRVPYILFDVVAVFAKMLFLTSRPVCPVPTIPNDAAKWLLFANAPNKFTEL